MEITKPPVLPSWAEAGDKVQPSNAEIQIGWPLSSIPPSRQRFNWLLNYLANGIRYFSRRGLPDYDAAETYMTGDRIIGDDGKTYRSLIDNNTAQTPSTSPTKWEEWAPTLSRFAALIQAQTYTAFTTAGAAPNFTLTPSPAIAAYAAGQRFRVKFHAAGAGANVLNVSALGNKELKQYNSTGAKVAAVIAVNQLTDVEYDGIDFVVLDPLSPNRGVQRFTANGSFTVPPGVSTIYVSGCAGGGGGGGGGGTTASVGSGCGGGGGAGQSIVRQSYTVTPGQVIEITIGGGGSPGGGGGAGTHGSNGTAGGNTVIGALVTLTGGGAGGGGGGSTGVPGAGAPGGTGYPSGSYGGDGGAGGVGGVGGTSPFGGGGGSGRSGSSTGVSGLSAVDFGAGGGGGGGVWQLAGNGAGGGAGAPGLVIIEW